MPINSLRDSRLFQILEKLISFPSYPGTNNLALIKYVTSYLDEFSIPYFITGKDTSHQVNLCAVIGPKVEGGIVLSGHTDIVGVEGQNWSHDPFALREDNGLLYGRGTCDMKGFLALILSMVPEFLEMNLKRPVCLSLSYDEETSCEGVQYLLKDFDAKIPKPAMAIIGEPSELGIIAAHKGDSHFTCEVKGLACHSSMPEKGVNAIYYASKMISALETIYLENKTLLKNDARYEPSHSSLSVGMIKGGSSVNTVADYCSFDWETRTIYHEDLDNILARLHQIIEEKLLPEMRKVHADSEINVIRHYTSPPLEYHTDSTILKHLSEHLGSGVPHRFVSFGTEAGYFQKAGIPSLIWGPGSINQAHKTDEFISIEQLESYHQSLHSFIAKLNRS